VFVLSLVNASERRDKIQAEFSRINLDFEFFDGVYGKDLSNIQIDKIYDDVKANKYIGRSLTKGEIGATYSHFKMYEKAVAQDLDYLIVLEDDVYFDQRLKLIHDNLVNSVENDPVSRVLFIQEHCNNPNIISNKVAIKLGDFVFNRMFSSEEYFVGAYGYIVNKKALQSLVANYLKFYFVCDHWFYVRKETKIKEFLFIKKSMVKTNDDVTREVDSFVQEERRQIIKKRNLSLYQTFKLSVKNKIFKIFNIDRYQ